MVNGASSATDATGTDGRCADCGHEVIVEAFGSICPNCGLVNDAQDDLDDRPVVWQPDRSTSARGNGATFPTTTQRVVARRGHAQEHANDAFRRRIEGDATRRRILSALTALGGFHDLFGDVKALLLRVDVMSRGEGDGAIDDVECAPTQPSITYGDNLNTAIAAACYVLVKQRRTASHAPSLDDFCRAQELSSERVRSTLRRIESLGTQDKIYDTPNAFIGDHIRFLLRQMHLPTRHRLKTPFHDPPVAGQSLFNRQDKAFVAQAQLQTPAFTTLAHALADLCAMHGLRNRAGRPGRRLDMSLCAWAVVMLTMEARAGGACCHEQLFAESAAWAPGWTMGRKTNGLTRAQLGLGSDQDGNEDVDQDEEVEGEDDAGVVGEEEATMTRKKTVRTIADVVKQRYGEISRMLSVYIRALPWYDGHAEQGTRHVKKRKSTAKGGSSSDCLPRPVVARHLSEVVQLRTQLAAEVTAALHADGLWKTNDADGTEDSTDLHFAFEAPPPAAAPEHMFSWATFKLARRPNDRASQHDRYDGHSKLARRLGRALSSRESLEQMDDDSVDRLLFASDEMQSYLRTPDEVEALRQVLARVQDDADADGQAGEVNSGSRRRARMNDKGRQTKAMRNEEFRELLNGLFVDDDDDDDDDE